jgi:hypothetical protein
VLRFGARRGISAALRLCRTIRIAARRFAAGLTTAIRLLGDIPASVIAATATAATAASAARTSAASFAIALSFTLAVARFPIRARLRGRRRVDRRRRILGWRRRGRCDWRALLLLALGTRFAIAAVRVASSFLLRIARPIAVAMTVTISVAAMVAMTIAIAVPLTMRARPTMAVAFRPLLRARLLFRFFSMPCAAEEKSPKTHEDTNLLRFRLARFFRNARRGRQCRCERGHQRRRRLGLFVAMADVVDRHRWLCGNQMTEAGVFG